MKRRGLTLVELAVSIALLSLVVLWSVNIIVNISQGSSTSEDLLIATNLASSKIEELKSYTYNDLNNLSNPTTGTFPSPYNNFSYKIVKNNTSQQGDYTIFRFTISVYKGSSTTPIIQLDANFVRRVSDGKNIGL